MTDFVQLRQRLNEQAADGNVDVEDVELALAGLWADQRVMPDEAALLHEILERYEAALEPAAKRYLTDRLHGTAAALLPRVLLGPVPRGASPDLYQPRSDVVRLQDALGVIGKPVLVDGLYGQGTARVVADVQREEDLSATGLLDSETLLRLNRRLVELGRPVLDLSPRARIRPDEVLAMKHGTNGTDNRRLQQVIALIGEAVGLEGLRLVVDGAFGQATEAAVRVIQARAYLPETGLVDRTTLAAINRELDGMGRPPIALAGSRVGGAELHFYPGDAELKCYVLRRGKVLDVYGMVGGYRQASDDPRSDVDYSPSPRGRYDLVEVSPHVAWSWAWSYVPYGADLRDVDGVVEFRDGSGKWKVATGPGSVFAGRNPPPIGRQDYLGADGKLPPTWHHNDFGHLRGRLRSQRTGNLQTHMIHPSADQEQTAAYFADTKSLLAPDEAMRRLRHSHGCEHIHPRDLDEMVAKGYLRPGAVFVVHGYDERFTS